ncbi:MAG: hypothetical protein KDE51_07885 [Anaerolineales bacterium]|nr:hypothetical protein [Anaerolineales bacterium]
MLKHGEAFISINVHSIPRLSPFILSGQLFTGYVNFMMGESYTAEYRSYLLRLWRNDAQQSWRVSATDTRSGRTHYFASVADLSQFLEGHADTLPTDTSTSPPQT